MKKLEEISKENKNLKEKVLDKQSVSKKELSSLKEQHDKDKSKWSSKLKHLEQTNSKLNDKISELKSDKDKKHSPVKESPKKDNGDISKLKATIIGMNVEKEKLTEQVARLKSSSLGKDNKMNGLRAEVSKLKEYITMLLWFE